MRIPRVGASVWWIDEDGTGYGPLQIARVYHMFPTLAVVSLTKGDDTLTVPLDDFWRRVNVGYIEFVEDKCTQLSMSGAAPHVGSEP